MDVSLLTQAGSSFGRRIERRPGVACLPLALFVLALNCAETRAGAATTTTNLGVGATVLPSCLVSTGSSAGTPGSATSECDNFGDGSVTISRDLTSSTPAPAGSRKKAPAGDTGSDEAGVTYVTIIY